MADRNFRDGVEFSDFYGSKCELYLVEERSDRISVGRVGGYRMVLEKHQALFLARILMEWASEDLSE